MSSKLIMNPEGKNHCDPSDATGAPDPEARAVLEVADNFMKYLGVQFGDSSEVDPDSRAKLEALLDVADKQLIDPEVLRRLTSSVSCALDEAAAALTRMRSEEPVNQSVIVKTPMNELARRMKQHGRMLDSELFSSEDDESDINCHSDADLDADAEDNGNDIDGEEREEDDDEEDDDEDDKDDDEESNQDQFGESCPIDSSLIEAYNLGDMEKVRKLIQESGNVNEMTEEGESLLSLACSSGYYELAQLLLAMKANVEDRGLKDTTPLMEAASTGHAQIVRLLLAHGADVSAQTSQGHTPLMYAAAGGHVEVVEILLEAGANVEDHNENGHTALMEAASAGHVEVARVLVNHGASINTHSNEFKESALTLACYKGHLEMVRFLLEAGADQEHKTEEMHTALMEASMDGHVEVARLLLDSGAQVNMPADSFESPLTLAACGGHVELAVLLLERGANIEEVNDEGYTPLMEAAREGHEEMVALLINHGAEINAQTEETQETALTLACCGGFLEVADLLLKHGADIEAGANTPLMEAAQEGHVDLVKYLIANRANVNAVTSSGDTALMYAAENGHVEVCQILFDAGAQIEHEAEGGRSPLMKAARAGHLNTVQFLMDRGANVNKVTTNNDHTPLSLACAGGHLSVVEFLLKRGADPTHRLKDNSTMLIEAAKGGHAGVVQLLIDWPNSGLTASDLAASASHLNLAAAESSQAMHHTCENGTNSLQTALTSKPTLPKARRRSASSNKVLERSLSDSSTPSTLANGSSCMVSSGNNNATNSLPLTLSAADNVVSTLGNFTAGIDTLKETERLEACISQMMKRTEMLNPSREEQILQKQQILEELQRVERELQQKAQTQLMLTVNAQQQQQQQHLLQSLLQASAGLPSNKSLTASNSVPSSTATPLSTYEALTNVLATSGGGGGLPSSVNHVDAATATNLSHSRSLSSSSTQIEEKEDVEVELDCKSKSNCESRGGDHDHADIASVQTAASNASPNTPSSGNVRQKKKLQSKSRLTSGSLLKNPATTVANQAPYTKASSDQVIPDVERMNYKNAELRSNTSNFEAKKKPESDFMANFQEAHLENIARLAQNLASNVPHLSQEQAALLANQVKRQGIDPEVFKSMLASSCINLAPDVTTGTDAASTAAIRPPASSHSGNKGSQKHDLVVNQKSLGAKSGENNSSIELSENQGVENAFEKTAQPTTKSSNKGKEKVSQTARSTSSKKLEGFPFNLAEAGEKGLSIPQLIPRLTPEQLEALKSGLAALSLQSGQSEVSSQLTKESGELPAVDVRAQSSGKRRSSSSVQPSEVNSSSCSDSVGTTASALRTDGDGSPSVIANGSASKSSSQGVVSSMVTPSIFGGKPEFSSVFPNPAPNTATNINNISFPALPVPASSLEAAGKMASSNASSVSASCATTLKPHLASDFNFAMMRPQCPNNQAAPASSSITKEFASSASSGKRSSDALIDQSKPQIEGSHAGTVRMAAGARPVTQTTTGVTTHGSTKVGRMINKKKVARRSEPLQRKEDREERTTSPPPWYNSSLDVDSQTDSNHDTALTLACAGGHEELVQLLLTRGADIEHRDKKGFTPLMLAATAGHANVVRILIENGTDMEAQSERTKDTALSLACSSGRYEVVEFLLQKGANKEHRNVSDYTPLSLAASGGYVNIIKLLLNHGTEINSRTGSKLGISPLMLAAMNGHTQAVKMLLDMGSDINAQIETNRNTALTLACFQGRAEVVSLLTERKANVEHRAKTGLTPLMEAASGGYVDVGRILIDKGADVNAAPVPSSRDTALTIAADKGHYRFVELLLDKGAAIDAKNKKGNSSLWLACNGGHLDVVQLLVSRGADIDSQDNRKVSCLMAAFRKGHVKVVKWMVKHVNQFPSDQEMTRYLALVNDKEVLKKCQQCMEIIRQQKERQAAEANRYASILLEEIDAEKSKEEEKRAAAAKRREKKKQKKKEKENAKNKNGTSSNESKSSNSKNGKDAKGTKGVHDSKDEAETSSSESDSDIGEEEPLAISILQQKHPNTASSTAPSNVRVTKSPVKEITKNQKSQQQSVAKNQQTSSSTTGKKEHPNSSATNVGANSENLTAAANKKPEKKKKEESTQDPIHSTNKKTTDDSKKQGKDKQGLQNTDKQSQIQQPDKDRIGSKENKQPAAVKKQQKQHNEVSKSANEKVSIDTTKELSTQVAAKKQQNEKSKEKDASEASQNSNKASQKSLTINNSTLTNPAQNATNTSPINSTNGNSAKKPSASTLSNLKRQDEEWKDVERSRKPRRVVVPANAISRVIGRGGCNINAVREYSGAHIEVEKQKGQGDRNVVIKGPTDAMKTAQTLIQELINEPDKDINEILQSLGLARRSSDDVIISKNFKPTATAISSSGRSASTSAGVLKSSSTPSVGSTLPPNQPQIVGQSVTNKPSAQPSATSFSTSGSAWGIKAGATAASPLSSVAKVPVGKISAKLKSDSSDLTSVNGNVSRTNQENRTTASNYGPQCVKTSYPTKQPFASLNSHGLSTNNSAQGQQVPNNAPQNSKGIVNQPAAQYNLFAGATQGGVWGAAKDTKPNFASVAAAGIATGTSNSTSANPGQQSGINVGTTPEQESTADLSKAPGYRGHFHHSPGTSNASNSSSASNNSGNAFGPIGPARSAPCTPPLNSSSISHGSAQIRRSPPDMSSSKADSYSASSNSIPFSSSSTSLGPIGSSKQPSISQNQSPLPQPSHLMSQSMGQRVGHHGATNTTYASQAPVSSISSTSGVSTASMAMNDSNPVLSNLNPNAPDFSTNRSYLNQLPSMGMQNGPSLLSNASSQAGVSSGNPPRVVPPQMAGEQLQLALLAISNIQRRQLPGATNTATPFVPSMASGANVDLANVLTPGIPPLAAQPAHSGNMGVPVSSPSSASNLSTPPSMQQFSATQLAIGIYQQQLQQQNQKLIAGHSPVPGGNLSAHNHGSSAHKTPTKESPEINANDSAAIGSALHTSPVSSLSNEERRLPRPIGMERRRPMGHSQGLNSTTPSSEHMNLSTASNVWNMTDFNAPNDLAGSEWPQADNSVGSSNLNNFHMSRHDFGLTGDASIDQAVLNGRGFISNAASGVPADISAQFMNGLPPLSLLDQQLCGMANSGLSTNFTAHAGTIDADAWLNSFGGIVGENGMHPPLSNSTSSASKTNNWQAWSQS